MREPLPERPAGRLLVVDGEATERLAALRAAAALGMEADAAAGMAEAMARLACNHYQVVVLALALRDHDGIELLRGLARAGSRAAVVLVSGLDERVRQAAARLAGSLGLTVAGTLAAPLAAECLAELLGAVPASAGPSANDDAAACAANPEPCLFQPIVTLERRRLVAVEARASCPTPELLARTLAAFRPWRAARPGLALVLNLRRANFDDLGLPDRLGAALALASVPPSSVVLEATEGAVMADYVAAADILTRLRIRGFRLAIDDFGTGRASLLALLRLPFSELKIGRRFVATCRDDPEAPKIIRAMASLARGLGLQLGAEGIETEPVAALLAGLGCTVGQGPLFARPLAPVAFGRWLADATWAEATA